MKKRFAVLFISILALKGNLVLAQQPTFEWARNFNGVDASSSSFGQAITTDASGNVYAAGSFAGTVDFDPGPGTYTLTEAGGDDVFVTKSDAMGNLIWAKSMGGTSTDEAKSVAVDANGNVYVCGSFYSTDFDPGSPSYTLASNGSDDMFICKLNSSGSVQWARGFGSAGFDNANSVSVGANGDICFTGYFSGTIDFNPGPSVYTLTASNSSYDSYLYKMDALGNLVWVNALGYGYGQDITQDGNGNIYTCGFYSGTVDFDPGPATNTLSVGTNYAFYVAKYSSSGSYIWARSLNSTLGAIGICGIAIDANNNVFTTGYFNTVIDFDPGSSVYTLTPTGLDAFVNKLDNNGNFSWAKLLTGPYQDYAKDVAVDAAGSVYVTGFYALTLDADPGPATYSLNGLGSDDVFVTKLDNSGSFIMAYGFGNSGFDQAHGINLRNNNIYLTGFFDGNVDFDPGAGTYTLSSAPSNYGTFVHKMSQCQAPATPSNLTQSSNTGACAGSTLQLLSASGTATINWYSSPTSTSAIASGTLLTTSSTLSPGTYSYYTQAQTCTLSPARTAIAFTVFANPTVAVSGSSVICNGETTSLTASGALSYSWNTGSSATIITVSPTSSSTYTVKGTDSNGCSNVATYALGVDACTGLKNKRSLSSDVIELYPNPANSILNVHLSGVPENSYIVVLNAGGQTVATQAAAEAKNSIDISSFADGVYIVTLQWQGQVSGTHKFIKH